MMNERRWKKKRAENLCNFQEVTPNFVHFKRNYTDAFAHFFFFERSRGEITASSALTIQKHVYNVSFESLTKQFKRNYNRHYSPFFCFQFSQSTDKNVGKHFVSIESPNHLFLYTYIQHWTKEFVVLVQLRAYHFCTRIHVHGGADKCEILESWAQSVGCWLIWLGQCLCSIVFECHCELKWCVFNREVVII